MKTRKITMGLTALALMGAMALPVSAQETDNTTITANVQSTYTLSIPAETQAFHNEVQHKDLPYELIDKRNDSTFTTATWDEDTLRNGLAGEGYGKELQLSVVIDEKNWQAAEAGDYTGTIIFTANLQDRRKPS